MGGVIVVFNNLLVIPATILGRPDRFRLSPEDDKRTLNMRHGANSFYESMCIRTRDPNDSNIINPNLCRMVVPQGGGGGTLIFSYIRRLRSFFGFKILNFNIFGVFRKMIFFWGYNDLVDIFWGHHKIGLYLGVISMHFMVFS